MVSPRMCPGVRTCFIRLTLLASLLLASGCASPPRTPGAPGAAQTIETTQFSVPPASEVLPESAWPEDRDAAARDLIENLPPSLLSEIRNETLSLAQILIEVGPILAQRTGLFHGNDALRESCVQPYTAALGIFLAARERELRGELNGDRETWVLSPENWPLTLEEACAETLTWLPEDERDLLASDSWEQRSFEQTLSSVLGRRYGHDPGETRKKNEALIQSLETSSPLAADPALILVWAIREKLRAEHRVDGLVPLENSPAGTPPPRLVYTTPVTFEECEIVLPPTHRLEAESWGAELAESIAEPIVRSFKLGEENTSLTRDASTPLACIPVIVRRAILLDRNDRLPLETQSPEDRWILGPDTWPLSLEGAARDLIEWIGPENCAALRDLAEANMDELHQRVSFAVFTQSFCC